MRGSWRSLRGGMDMLEGILYIDKLRVYCNNLNNTFKLFSPLLTSLSSVVFSNCPQLLRRPAVTVSMSIAPRSVRSERLFCDDGRCRREAVSARRSIQPLRG